LIYHAAIILVKQHKASTAKIWSMSFMQKRNTNKLARENMMAKNGIEIYS
jgi:hypothetical protein